MTYKSIVFWGGLVVLDSLLFLGLPERAETTALQQPRLEPVHCWEGVNDGRQVAVASDNGSVAGQCQPGGASAEQGETVQPQLWKPELHSAPPYSPRLQVNISIQPAI
jgi:hypothetical protein